MRRQPDLSERARKGGAVQEPEGESDQPRIPHGEAVPSSIIVDDLDGHKNDAERYQRLDYGRPHRDDMQCGGCERDAMRDSESGDGFDQGHPPPYQQPQTEHEGEMVYT